MCCYIRNTHLLSQGQSFSALFFQCLLSLFLSLQALILFLVTMLLFVADVRHCLGNFMQLIWWHVLMEVVA